MSSTSASDHGNPAAMAVYFQKGLLRRGRRRIETSVSCYAGADKFREGKGKIIFTLE